MLTGWVMVGRALVTAIVCAPVPIENVIESVPGFEFAFVIAPLREQSSAAAVQTVRFVSSDAEFVVDPKFEGGVWNVYSVGE